MAKDEVLKAVAGVLLACWIFIIALAMFGFSNPVEEGGAQTSLSIAGICTIILLIPAVILLYLAFRITNKEKKAEDLASLLHMYRRISLADLAEKVGKTEIEVEKEIVEAIKMGKVQGYIDRTTNEFFTKESMTQQLEVRDVATLKCSACNGSLPGTYMRGQTFECPHCGVKAQVIDKLPPPPPPLPVYPRAPPATQRKKRK